MVAGKRKNRRIMKWKLGGSLFVIAVCQLFLWKSGWMADGYHAVMKQEFSETELKERGIPESLIELYDRNEEARQFVLDYPEYKNTHAAIDITDEVKKGTIPLFLQWDERWGYESYGEDFLAISGCGPTALSMVYTGLTGHTDLNPLKMAQLAEENGYYVKGSGSAWSMMTGLAKQIGLSSKEMVFDEQHILQALKNGHPIICIMGVGDFTTSGHFIVLTGLAANGEIIVHDSNSRKNSGKTWKLERLMSQIRNLWEFQM